MLKSFVPTRSSPASSPRFHYAPSPKSLPASPSSGRNPKLKPQESASRHTLPLRTAQYVDAATQWSPIINSEMATQATKVDQPTPAEKEPLQEQQLSFASPPAIAPPSPSKPTLQPESPGLKRRKSSDVAAPAISSASLPTKRSKSAQKPVKILPARYEFCPVEDMVVLIANMISELIQTNDHLPLRSGVLTRFHSRTPPGISVLDYLQRLAKHATLTPPLLLSMVYYIDRLCLLYPAFTITTLTVHRFLITAATVAAKGLSDSFWNNATYARVGGIKIAELGLLELDFLYRVDWKIVPNPETLVEYYKGLIERSDGYELETDPSSSEESDEHSEASPALVDEEEMKSAGTNEKWKEWMDDVSTKKAEDGHEDKPA